MLFDSADYHVLKMQWKTMLPDQLKRCTKFVNTRAQIGLPQPYSTRHKHTHPQAQIAIVAAHAQTRTL